MGIGTLYNLDFKLNCKKSRDRKFFIQFSYFIVLKESNRQKSRRKWDQDIEWNERQQGNTIDQSGIPLSLVQSMNKCQFPSLKLNPSGFLTAIVGAIPRAKLNWSIVQAG